MIKIIRIIKLIYFKYLSKSTLNFLLQNQQNNSKTIKLTNWSQNISRNYHNMIQTHKLINSSTPINLSCIPSKLVPSWNKPWRFKADFFPSTSTFKTSTDSLELKQMNFLKHEKLFYFYAATVVVVKRKFVV